MIVVHATFPVDPDKHDEAVELFREVAARSREEDGILGYRVTTDVEESSVFTFVEQYEDETAFGAHSETEHVAELRAALPDLLAGEPEVVQFEVASATELDF
jgi:quinol monooxygenase YgiN